MDEENTRRLKQKELEIYIPRVQRLLESIKKKTSPQIRFKLQRLLDTITPGNQLPQLQMLMQCERVLKVMTFGLSNKQPITSEIKVKNNICEIEVEQCSTQLPSLKHLACTLLKSPQQAKNDERESPDSSSHPQACTSTSIEVITLSSPEASPCQRDRSESPEIILDTNKNSPRSPSPSNVTCKSPIIIPLEPQFDFDTESYILLDSYQSDQQLDDQTRNQDNNSQLRKNRDKDPHVCHEGISSGRTEQKRQDHLDPRLHDQAKNKDSDKISLVEDSNIDTIPEVAYKLIPIKDGRPAHQSSTYLTIATAIETDIDISAMRDRTRAKLGNNAEYIPPFKVIDYQHRSTEPMVSGCAAQMSGRLSNDVIPKAVSSFSFQDVVTSKSTLHINNTKDLSALQYCDKTNAISPTRIAFCNTAIFDDTAVTSKLQETKCMSKINSFIPSRSVLDHDGPSHMLVTKPLKTAPSYIDKQQYVLPTNLDKERHALPHNKSHYPTLLSNLQGNTTAKKKQDFINRDTRHQSETCANVKLLPKVKSSSVWGVSKGKQIETHQPVAFSNTTQESRTASQAIVNSAVGPGITSQAIKKSKVLTLAQYKAARLSKQPLAKLTEPQPLSAATLSKDVQMRQFCTANTDETSKISKSCSSSHKHAAHKEISKGVEKSVIASSVKERCKTDSESAEKICSGKIALQKSNNSSKVNPESSKTELDRQSVSKSASGSRVTTSSRSKSSENDKKKQSEHPRKRLFSESSEKLGGTHKSLKKMQPKSSSSENCSSKALIFESSHTNVSLSHTNLVKSTCKTTTESTKHEFALEGYKISKMCKEDKQTKQVQAQKGKHEVSDGELQKLKAEASQLKVAGSKRKRVTRARTKDRNESLTDQSISYAKKNNCVVYSSSAETSSDGEDTMWRSTNSDSSDSGKTKKVQNQAKKVNEGETRKEVNNTLRTTETTRVARINDDDDDENWTQPKKVANKRGRGNKRGRPSKTNSVRTTTISSYQVRQPLQDLSDPQYFPHPGEDKICCLVCNYEGKKVVQHYLSHHPDIEVLYSRLSPEEAMVAINVDENPPLMSVLSCRFCPQTFLEINELFDHVTEHTGEYRYKCPICPDVVRQYARLVGTHIKNYHPGQEKLVEPLVLMELEDLESTRLPGYVCGFCRFVQCDRARVEQHIEVRHRHEVGATIPPGVQEVNEINLAKLQDQHRYPELHVPKEEPMDLPTFSPFYVENIKQELPEQDNMDSLFQLFQQSPGHISTAALLRKEESLHSNMSEAGQNIDFCT